IQVQEKCPTTRTRCRCPLPLGRRCSWPVPPLNIPQSTIEANAMTDAMNNNGNGLNSPGSAGGPRRAAPEPNKRALYVGGLDPRVTEEVLKQIFETTGHVQSVKIIPDKNFQSKGFNYGFVEYDDPLAAERAMQTLNGRRVHQSEIRVNWAYQSNTTSKEDTSGHFHIFVGDLSNEVNDEVLLQAFSAFGSVSEARVMWDMKTGRSRGYGFVAFRDRAEAEKALSSMDGEWLGSRAIRCNWANQKGQPSFAQQQAMAQMGITLPVLSVSTTSSLLKASMADYLLCWQPHPYTTQNDLVPLFQNFGYVTETRFQSDRGFAFVKMDSHENAAMAICQLNGYNVNGRPLKCSWGKDRPPTTNFEGFSPAAAAAAVGGNAGYPPTPQGFGFPRPSPVGFQQPAAQFAGGNMAAYGQMPQNGGGFGRGNYMGGPQGGAFNNYGGYQA
ncbi:unnamed protein product, partial [Aureobasidium vineae]